MNPTDQARKEARKKELKKNKKQRQLVRTAVLKNKDPGIIIKELDKLDEIEYNPTEAPPLADKVLKDKRKKLKETLDRVMKLYVSLFFFEHVISLKRFTYYLYLIRIIVKYYNNSYGFVLQFVAKR